MEKGKTPEGVFLFSDCPQSVKLGFVGQVPEMQNAECIMHNCGITFGNDLNRRHSRHNHSALCIMNYAFAAKGSTTN